jgi:hypothetical protein
MSRLFNISTAKSFQVRIEQKLIRLELLEEEKIKIEPKEIILRAVERMILDSEYNSKEPMMKSKMNTKTLVSLMIEKLKD